jgi:hypothetical protein
LLEREQRETVAGGVLLRDTVPAEVLDDNAGTVADMLEADVDLGLAAGWEGGCPPAEDQLVGRVPDPDVPDLELHAVGVRLDDPAAEAGFDGELAVTSTVELEQ